MTAAGDESRHSEGQLAALCPQLTATSLNLPPDMRFPIWEQLGEALARAERSLLWYLADWWVWAREKRLPPEEIHTIAGRLGFAVHTLDTYASVARAFETSRRLEILSFTHHQEVAGLSKEQMTETILAYEPVWAIGTGKTASTAQAQEAHAFIRSVLVSTFDPTTAEGIRIQYGGSVKPENAQELMAQKDVDGALVGGACLNPESFARIVQCAEK